MDMQEALNIEPVTEVNLLEAFLCDCQIRNFSPGTIASYKSYIKCFLKFYPVSANMNDLKDFLVLLRDERELSVSSIENYFCSLSTFYEFLVWERIVKENIIPHFRKRYIRYYKEPRPEERQLISLEQMKNLIDSTESLQTKTMFLVFAKTGIRRQELIDLDGSDVYLQKNMIVLKNHHHKRGNRTVFFDGECSFYLEKWLKWRHNHKAKVPALFLGLHGKRISRDRVYELTTEHAEKLGFHDSEGQLHEKFTPHCFRHFFTTWMRRSGCPRAAIQEFRGDSRKEAVDIYDHWTMEELKETYLKYVPKLKIK